MPSSQWPFYIILGKMSNGLRKTGRRITLWFGLCAEMKDCVKWPWGSSITSLEKNTDPKFLTWRFLIGNCIYENS